MSGVPPPFASPAEASQKIAAAELVIFDFDGVVADSEVLSLATLQEALAQIDLPLSLDEVRQRFLGTSLTKISAVVADHSPGTNTEAFATRWETALFARFRAELNPVDGVVALLDQLDRVGPPYCIGSSGSLKRIHIALEAMGLVDRFQHVFSAEQVAKGKPAPDLFLHAAGQFGMAPEQCLVIEDSTFGVQAAQAAQMGCMGFVGGGHLRGMTAEHAARLLEAGADLVIDRFDGIRP